MQRYYNYRNYGNSDNNNIYVDMFKKRWWVDAYELILHLNDYKLQQSPIDVQDIESINVRAVIQDCIKAVEEQPTAYDVDKVVEQLKNEKEFWSDANAHNKEIGKQKERSYKHAIEIVKGGGMND